MTVKNELRIWEKTHLEELVVDWRKTLKWILKLGGKMCGRLIWIRIETSVELL
jgi:hypothetical protein